MSLEEWEATLDALKAESDGLPVLSQEATTRAGIYGGHDTALASEQALSKIWDTPEEDAAWQHLNK